MSALNWPRILTLGVLLGIVIHVVYLLVICAWPCESGSMLGERFNDYPW